MGKRNVYLSLSEGNKDYGIQIELVDGGEKRCKVCGEVK